MEIVANPCNLNQYALQLCNEGHANNNYRATTTKWSYRCSTTPMQHHNISTNVKKHKMRYETNINEKTDIGLMQHWNATTTKPTKGGHYATTQWRCTWSIKTTPMHRRCPKLALMQINIEVALMQRCIRRKCKNKKWKETLDSKHKKEHQNMPKAWWHHGIHHIAKATCNDEEVALWDLILMEEKRHGISHHQMYFQRKENGRSCKNKFWAFRRGRAWI